ncbi:MAG: GIY-YIG nuclease family protein [Clostridia bacterium]|nr:GIY-YIG nuclease family protein [Clostridia bacterium]
MNYANYKQIYAVKKANEERILKVCPNCPRTSGIYFLLREENGFKFGYIGKAKHLLERLGSHLSGRKQWIDKSLYKHGLYSETNPCGYKVHFLEFPENMLDEKEQYYIRKYASAGYQLRNVESGGNLGKTDIGERKPAKKYFDGVEQGKKNTREFVKHLFDLHLDFVPKKNPPTKLQERAMQKFKDFLEYERNEE